MQKKTGIVLKTYFPHKQKLVLFDDHLGKIEGVVATPFSSGSLLSYHTQQRNTVYFLQSIDLIDIPFTLAAQDILFLHHVLEIVYFFAPYNARCLDIFDLIRHLYKEEINPYTHSFKIAFLFKLLIVLGMHPDKPQFQNPFYFVLGQESIDTIVHKSIQLDTKYALHEWVRDCLKASAYEHVFKTLHFLDTDRLL